MKLNNDVLKAFTAEETAIIREYLRACEVQEKIYESRGKDKERVIRDMGFRHHIPKAVQDQAMKYPTWRSALGYVAMYMKKRGRKSLSETKGGNRGSKEKE